MQRQFSAHAPNQVWLADITERRTDEGKLYLCALKDVYSNRFVGYSIDSRMKSSLAVAALDHAVALPSPVATMESFFALLQRNVLDRRRWTTRAELRHGTTTYPRLDNCSHC